LILDRHLGTVETQSWPPNASNIVRSCTFGPSLSALAFLRSCELVLNCQLSIGIFSTAPLTVHYASGTAYRRYYLFWAS